MQKKLEESYRLDENESNLILKKVAQFFKSYETCTSLVDDFLSLSNEIVLTPPIHQKLSVLGGQDAVLKAPQWHRILFENDFLRILEVMVQPGETVPFHTHQWDSIMVTFQGSRFRIEDISGSVIEEDWEPIAEKLEGSFTAYSYSNIGTQAFRALAFEFKQ